MNGDSVNHVNVMIVLLLFSKLLLVVCPSAVLLGGHTSW